jgi:hypothetical protein
VNPALRCCYFFLCVWNKIKITVSNNLNSKMRSLYCCEITGGVFLYSLSKLYETDCINDVGVDIQIYIVKCCWLLNHVVPNFKCVLIFTLVHRDPFISEQANAYWLASPIYSLLQEYQILLNLRFWLTTLICLAFNRYHCKHHC